MTYPEFLLMLVVTLAIGLVSGLYIFGDFKNITIHQALSGFRKNIRYVLILALILFAVVLESHTHDWLGSFFGDQTETIYSLSLNGALVETIQAFRTPGLDFFFIAIYLYFFIFMLLFTPLLFSVRNDTLHLKNYVLAMAIAYSIMIVFYLVFPVRTTGQSGLIDAYPVLYSDPVLLKFIQAFDPLDNCFPSGHVADPIIVTALLLPLRQHKEYARFTMFSLTISVLVAISVLYLGIHWELDVVAGIVLAIFSVWLSKNATFRSWLRKLLIKMNLNQFTMDNS